MTQPWVTYHCPHSLEPGLRTPCSICWPLFSYNHDTRTATPVPIGCICPPTSEQTCQRPDCGRRSAHGTVTVLRDTGGGYP